MPFAYTALLVCDGIGPRPRTSDPTTGRDDRSGTGEVSPYAAAARATDVSGLPPTFVARLL